MSSDIALPRARGYIVLGKAKKRTGFKILQREDNSLELVSRASSASTEYEKANTELKRQYLVKIIDLYNSIVKDLSGYEGSFGTGYPFYSLNTDLTGQLPIIQEQIRYNLALTSAAFASNQTIWPCAKCLKYNGKNMPDLKTKCKVCEKTENELKPRKVINRLPDMDLWMVCRADEIENSKQTIITRLRENNLFTSDVDPIQTITDVEEIANDLSHNRMPEKYVPIDTHIIDYDTLLSLIEQIPATLERAMATGEIPYLPIHPISYRKNWQKDDEPYNFVHDYLSSFTSFNFEPTLREKLENTRKIISKLYTIDELYNFLLMSGPDSAKRRNECPALRKSFEKKVLEWRQ
jgi:hypothetical protein